MGGHDLLGLAHDQPEDLVQVQGGGDDRPHLDEAGQPGHRVLEPAKLLGQAALV